jgi:hypothetical protein
MVKEQKPDRPVRGAPVRVEPEPKGEAKPEQPPREARPDSDAAKSDPRRQNPKVRADSTDDTGERESRRRPPMM